MFTPQKLEKMPVELEKLFSRLEMDIMMDIIRRMKINNNEITRSADWQIYRLNQLGQSKKSIKKYIEKSLELSEKEINNIYKNAIKSGYAEDKELYTASGKSFIEFEDNEELQQLITAIKEQTKNDFYNITQSTGFIKNINGKNVFTPLTQYYQETLDNAVSGVLSGAFDYNTVIKKTVQEMTKSGLRTIDYASGRSYRIDSVVRTAVMTGVNQVASKISDSNAKELDTEYFEVSAHGTARPSHQEWQGKVYTRKQLEEICGLGKVDGLCGANCRHSYYPFIPGISERSYTDKELEEWAKEENKPKEYNGKQYTAYEASQEQRRLERLMRKQRQDIKLLKEGEANEEDIITAQAKYRITSDEYVKFSKSMGLPEQRARIYQDGLKIRANELKLRDENGIIKPNYLVKKDIGVKNTFNEQLSINEAVSMMPKNVQKFFTKNTKFVVGNNSSSSYDRKTDTFHIMQGSNKFEIIHEIGHLVETKLNILNNAKYNKIREKIALSGSVIKSSDYGSKEIFLLKGNNLVSEYQGYIYANNIKDIYINGKINYKLLGEIFSEGFREYFEAPENLKNINTELYSFIEEVLK